MVDLQSKYRLYNIGYTAIQPRAPTPTLRELYHESGRKLFSDRKDRPVHDCRAEVVKNNTALEEWDAWLLSHGLRSTYGDCVGSHEKQRDLHTPREKKIPAKLLFQIGIKGSEHGDFHYPRGVCNTEKGDIIVADSYNHRIQVFNRSGIFKVAFGRQGCSDGAFNEPTDVVELPDERLAVADRRNTRIQIFSEKGVYLDQFFTGHAPYSLACDHQSHLVVCTVGRTVELYKDLHFLRVFPVPVNSAILKKGGDCPLHVGITRERKIIVSDPLDQCIKAFSFEGCMLRQFRPQSHADGLTCCPGGLFVTPIDQLLVADVLNHSVSLYTDTGSFLQQVLVPTDDVGCVHSLSLSPEGHLIISEFSMTGDHTVKIFRYRDCVCHRGRPPTSKRRTLTTLH